MAHRSMIVHGNVLLVVVLLAIAGTVVSSVVAPQGAWIWAATAIAASGIVLLSVRHHRIESAREQAWEHSFSFAEVVARRRAETQRRIEPS